MSRFENQAGAGPQAAFWAQPIGSEQKKKSPGGDRLGLQSFVEKEGKPGLEGLPTVTDRTKHLVSAPKFWDSFPGAVSMSRLSVSLACIISRISTSLLRELSWKGCSSHWPSRARFRWV